MSISSWGQILEHQCSGVRTVIDNMLVCNSSLSAVDHMILEWCHWCVSLIGPMNLQKSKTNKC